MGAGSPQTVGPDAAPLLDPFDEDVRREIERAIRDRAARGNVVILGRVGNAVLAGMPGLARAFVYAERDWRLGRLMTAFGFDLVKANSEIDRTDVGAAQVCERALQGRLGRPALLRRHRRRCRASGSTVRSRRSSPPSERSASDSGTEGLEVEPPVPRRRSTVLDTFRFRDFRLLWGGLLISNLGTWMQFTTLGYVVVTLAGTPRLAALDVGILGACNAVPR